MHGLERSARLRILLVEDLPDAARPVSRLLGDEPALRVERVPRLDQALERLGGRRYDAVLLDLGAPGAETLRALLAVRDAAPRPPVLVCSGEVDDELALRALRLGAQDFLVKRYVAPRTLLRAIHYAIERKRLADSCQALRDELTALPAATLFEDRLEHALGEARRRGERVALIHLSARSAGISGDDAGLRADVARRLVSVLRASDTVARIGLEEFAVILTDLAEIGDVARVVDKILDAVRRPFDGAGAGEPVAAAAGVAVFPDDGDSAEALRQGARTALGRVLPTADAGCHYEHPVLEARSDDKPEMRSALLDALRRAELFLEFQPEIDLASGRFTTPEALVRWAHPGGRMPPALFLPAAEETGLMGEVGEWVLRNACRQCGDWRRSGAEVRIAVNVAASQLHADGFAGTVQRILRETSLEPDCLELEVKEDDLLRNWSRASATLARLHAAGTSIAVDDYGRGLLPLQRLEELPATRVKLDRSLVRDVARDERAAAVVRGIVALAHGLELRATAKGVESEAQLAVLRESRCDGLQGFYVARPAEAARILPLLRGGPVAADRPPSL